MNPEKAKGLEHRAMIQETSGGEIARYSAELERDPNDLEARLRLYVALVSRSVENGFRYDAEELAPHIVKFIEQAPHLTVTNSLDIIKPSDKWHALLAEKWACAVRSHWAEASVLMNAASFYWSWHPDEVERLLERARTIAPEDPAVRAGSGSFQLRGADLDRVGCSYADAARFLDGDGSIDPVSPGLPAVAAFAVGKFERAAELAQLAIRMPVYLMEDEPHLGHTVMGLLAARDGRCDQACSSLKASTVKHLSYGAGPSMRLASCLLEMGRRDAVREYLTAIMESWPWGRDTCREWLDVIATGAAPRLLNAGR